MNESELKKQTYQLKYGNWIGRGQTNEKLSIEVQISIAQDKVKLRKTINNIPNEEEVFNSDTWWVEQFLEFLDAGQKYFILGADEMNMRFGEKLNPAVYDGQYVWLINFKRVSNNQ